MLTPTTSLAGTVQIVARVLEVALHKATRWAFRCSRRRRAGHRATAAAGPDFLTAMGRTNDAVLFGGEVQLFVAGPRRRRGTGQRLPSSNWRDYGRPFAELFEAAGYDFYKSTRCCSAPPG